MLQKTKGILLRRIKYGDNSKIAHIFTREFGKQSYLVYGSKSKKKIAVERYLQPMYILDMQVYYKENKGLQKIKEISPDVHLISIPFDIRKNAVCQLTAELINKTMRDNEADKPLFDFLSGAIQLLDYTENNISNFTPVFLVKYSRFLGLQPEANYSETKTVFDMQLGKFITGRPLHKNFFVGESASKVNEFIKMSFSDFNQIQLSKSLRNEIINGFIDYFNYHLNKPGRLNSLLVFSEIFA